MKSRRAFLRDSFRLVLAAMAGVGYSKCNREATPEPTPVPVPDERSGYILVCNNKTIAELREYRGYDYA